MCTLFLCCMPSIKVYGSSNNSINSEEITKLPAISFEITKIPEESEITKIPEIQETPRSYLPNFRDLEEFTNLK